MLKEERKALREVTSIGLNDSESMLVSGHNSHVQREVAKRELEKMSAKDRSVLEAQKILSDAKVQAKRIIESAQAQANSMLASAARQS